MKRVRTVPVHDSTGVRDARVAAEEAGARARLDAHRTAVAAPVASEPATVPRDAGSAAGPVRDDTRVAVPACDRPAGRP
ncbi:hypothetical protein ACWER6_21025 [Streptomyces sp. NPDC004009]